MKKGYEQSKVLRCSATIRPSYCKYSGNVCCFSCDSNVDCMDFAVKNHLIKPCSDEILFKFNGRNESVKLFSKTEFCEFSI